MVSSCQALSEIGEIWRGICPLPWRTSLYEAACQARRRRLRVVIIHLKQERAFVGVIRQLSRADRALHTRGQLGADPATPNHAQPGLRSTKIMIVNAPPKRVLFMRRGTSDASATFRSSASCLLGVADSSSERWLSFSLSLSAHHGIRSAPQDIMNIRAPMSLTIQSTPFASPSPVTALQPRMLQCRLANCVDSRPSASAISAAPSAPARSCLLAKTSKDAPASFCEGACERPRCAWTAV